MKAAPDESGIKKDLPESATEWIAKGGKRCTDDAPGRGGKTAAPRSLMLVAYISPVRAVGGVVDAGIANTGSPYEAESQLSQDERR